MQATTYGPILHQATSIVELSQFYYRLSFDSWKDREIVSIQHLDRSRVVRKWTIDVNNAEIVKLYRECYGSDAAQNVELYLPLFSGEEWPLLDLDTVRGSGEIIPVATLSTTVDIAVLTLIGALADAGLDWSAIDDDFLRALWDLLYHHYCTADDKSDPDLEVSFSQEVYKEQFLRAVSSEDLSFRYAEIFLSQPVAVSWNINDHSESTDVVKVTTAVKPDGDVIKLADLPYEPSYFVHLSSFGRGAQGKHYRFDSPPGMVVDPPVIFSKEGAECDLNDEGVGEHIGVALSRERCTLHDAGLPEGHYYAAFTMSPARGAFLLPAFFLSALMFVQALTTLACSLLVTYSPSGYPDTVAAVSSGIIAVIAGYYVSDTEHDVIQKYYGIHRVLLTIASSLLILTGSCWGIVEPNALVTRVFALLTVIASLAIWMMAGFSLLRIQGRRSPKFYEYWGTSRTLLLSLIDIIRNYRHERQIYGLTVRGAVNLTFKRIRRNYRYYRVEKRERRKRWKDEHGSVFPYMFNLKCCRN